MFEELKKKKLRHSIVTGIRDYNEKKSTDLPKIGDSFLDLANELNKQITKTEKRIRRHLVQKIALKYNKLILTSFELEARLHQYQFLAKHRRDKQTLENLDLYTKITNEVEKQFEEIIKNDEELTSLKTKFHSTLWVYGNPNYKQITKSTKSPFDSCTFTQLLEMLDSKTFYNFKTEEICQLYQAIANKYCTSMGIKELPIIFEYKKYNDSLGSYTRFGNYIHINAEYLKVFEELKSKGLNNKYLQYKILQTVIHECRHSYQGTNTRNNAKSRYIQNCAKINTHYLFRLYYPNHQYEENYTHYGYGNRLIELDAQNEANQFLIDISKTKLCNSKEIQLYALGNLPKTKYQAKNSVIKEIFELVSNHGLTHPLSKMIYENMKFLGLTAKNNLVTYESGKIDYAKTNEANLQSLNTIKVKLALARETRLRESYFPTLFNPDGIIEPYAIKSGMTVAEYREQIEEELKQDKDDCRTASILADSYILQ